MADRSFLGGSDAVYLSGILEVFPDKKDEVIEWFQTMESINIGLGFADVTMKRTLIDKLGVKKYLQVIKEAVARGTVPEDRGERTFTWLKEETIRSFGEKRTLYSRLQAVVSRRLNRTERVKEYRADVERYVDEFWGTLETLMKRSGDERERETQNAAELAAKQRLCCNVYTMGLPRELKVLTLNSLPRADDQTMEKLELVTTNLREGELPTSGGTRPVPKEENGTLRMFPTTERSFTLLKCVGCGGEHRLCDCPHIKQRISGRLRSSEKTVSYMEDEAVAGRTNDGEERRFVGQKRPENREFIGGTRAEEDKTRAEENKMFIGGGRHDDECRVTENVGFIGVQPDNEKMRLDGYPPPHVFDAPPKD